MLLITRACFYAVLSLYVWFAISHTLVGIITEEEEEEEEQGEREHGEGEA